MSTAFTTTYMFWMPKQVIFLRKHASNYRTMFLHRGLRWLHMADSHDDGPRDAEHGGVRAGRLDEVGARGT